MLELFANYGCYGLTEAWCAVYGLVVAIVQFVVEWFFHSALEEDGSWANLTGPSGCAEILGWGCIN